MKSGSCRESDQGEEPATGSFPLRVDAAGVLKSSKPLRRFEGVFHHRFSLDRLYNERKERPSQKAPFRTSDSSMGKNQEAT